MNILVTGASKGLGLAICENLLEQGHTVYAISRNSSKELIDIENKYSGRFYFKCFNLSESEDIHNDLFKKFIPYSIILDGFVNNAAIAYDDIITNINFIKLEEMYRVNVFSPMIITKYVIRNMLFNKNKGTIIHISSISVHTGYKGLSMYASSKGALEAFSKNTAREWGPIGIRSNVVVPGFMETAMSSKLSNEQKNKIYGRTAIKLPISIKSVANTVSFLLSDMASSITGQNIFVDNGTI